jgi:hypothetical protein
LATEADKHTPITETVLYKYEPPIIN